MNVENRVHMSAQENKQGRKKKSTMQKKKKLKRFLMYFKIKKKSRSKNLNQFHLGLVKTKNKWEKKGSKKGKSQSSRNSFQSIPSSNFASNHGSGSK